MMNKSNKLMSLMSLWGIILVVLGHSGFEETIVMDNLLGLHKYIYSYHMPLFFFISGYLYALTNPDFARIDPLKFLKKKILRLYVPYVVLGLIIFCIKWGLSGLSHTERDFSVSNFFMMFIAPHWQSSTMGYLWYIVTLYFLFVFVTILSVCKIDLRNIVVALLLIVLFWGLKLYAPSAAFMNLFNLSSLLWYTPFFIMGVLYDKYENSLSILGAFNGWTKPLLLFCISVSSAFVAFDNTVIDMMFRIFYAIVGIVFSMSFCNGLLQSYFIQKNVLHYGDMTYTIYLLSFFGQYTAKVLFVNIMHAHWSICVIAMFAAGLLFPILVYRIVRRSETLYKSKFLKLIIGI